MRLLFRMPKITCVENSSTSAGTQSPSTCNLSGSCRQKIHDALVATLSLTWTRQGGDASLVPDDGPNFVSLRPSRQDPAMPADCAEMRTQDRGQRSRETENRVPALLPLQAQGKDQCRMHHVGEPSCHGPPLPAGSPSPPGVPCLPEWADLHG